MNRLGQVGVAVAGVTLAMALGLPAVGSSDDRGRGRDLRFDAVIAEAAFIDAGDAGPSLGDQIVFTNTLTSSGSEVGHEGAVCTTVSVTRQEAQCTATFALQGGQVTAEGLVTLGSMDPYAVPVTGGSGRYRGVGGELRVTPVSETEGQLILRLTTR